MTIDQFIDSIIEKFKIEMPPEDFDFVRSIGDFGDLDYETYKKNPEKWNKFNEAFEAFQRWHFDNSVYTGTGRFMKFSDIHFLTFQSSGRINQVEVRKVDETKQGQKIHHIIYPHAGNKIDGGSNFKWLKEEYEKEKGDPIPLWGNPNTDFKQLYLERLKSIDDLKLCIVGQDRYKTGANGVAFCKNSFDELYDENCCGKDVLNSLGISEENARGEFENPFELFLSLLDQGIAFINLSHDLLVNDTSFEIKKYKQYNIHFLLKASKVVVLGTTQTVPLFEKYYPEIMSFTPLIHPSGRAKDSSPVIWDKVWGGNHLKKLIDTAKNE